MNAILAFVFIALGVIGFAIAAWTAKGPGFYSYGSELVLYGTLIAAGVGLYLSRPFGRVMALAWLRAGSWAIFVVPIGLVLAFAMLQGGGGSLVAIPMILLLMVVGSGKPDYTPLLYVGGVLVALAIVSFVCARLYRRLASSQALDDDERARVRFLAIALVFIAFAAQKRIVISEYELPGTLQSTTTKELQKQWAEEALQELAGIPLMVDGGKGLLFEMGNRVGHMHYGLVYVDLATGKATQTTLPTDLTKDRTYFVETHESRFSPEGPLMWAAETNELADLHTGRRVKAAIEEKWNAYRAIGFVDGSKRFLVLDIPNAHILAIDTATGAVAYTADATPPGGFSSEQYRTEFASRVATSSAFSADRSRLAWYYLDTLYVMDTAGGTISSLPLRVTRDSEVHFSRDDAHVFTMTNYDKPMGRLVDPTTRTVKEHSIKARALIHFSGAQGVILHRWNDDYKNTAVTLSRWDLADLVKPVWTATFENRQYLCASADGKRLYGYNAASHVVESAELGDLKGEEAQIEFKPMPITLQPGALKYLSCLPDGVLVPVQSPKMSIVRLDASGGVASSRVVDFTPFAYKPK